MSDDVLSPLNSVSQICAGSSTLQAFIKRGVKESIYILGPEIPLDKGVNLIYSAACLNKNVANFDPGFVNFSKVRRHVLQTNNLWSASRIAVKTV